MNIHQHLPIGGELPHILLFYRLSVAEGSRSPSSPECRKWKASAVHELYTCGDSWRSLGHRQWASTLSSVSSRDWGTALSLHRVCSVYAVGACGSAEPAQYFWGNGKPESCGTERQPFSFFLTPTAAAEGDMTVDPLLELERPASNVDVCI